MVAWQELNLFRAIKWRNGHPPLDEPECGFYGEKCVKEFGKYKFEIMCRKSVVEKEEEKIHASYVLFTPLHAK